MRCRALSLSITVHLALLGFLGFAMPLDANGADQSAVAAQEWGAYIEPMIPLGQRMVSGLEDPDDPWLRQELYRQLFSGMSAAYIGSFLGDARYPDFWPIANMAYNFLSPNPDDAYSMAPLDGKGIYRIYGFRGTVHMVDFSITSGDFFPRGTGPLGPVVDHYDLDKQHINQDGSFEVLLSPERPAGYQGDWWKLDSKATHVLVRQRSYDWLHEVDGRFAIERADLPAIRPRLTATEIQAKLANIATWAETWSKFSSRWVKGYRDQGLVNKVASHALNANGGHAMQHYIEGIFELDPDEALIYETEIPERCRYWNIGLTTLLMNSIDYMNRQSSINGYTARLDKDGKFRAVISARDPGVPNWLDTAGYAKGTMFGRWTECSSWPTPTVTKIKLADVRKYLPSDTPAVTAEARDAAIRLRRRGAQLRRRW